MRVLIIFVGVSALVAGCSSTTTIEDNFGTGSGATGGTGTTGDSTGGTTGPDLGTGGDSSFCGTQDKVCEENKGGNTGDTCAFEGLTYTPNTVKRQNVTFNFTCTACPGGDFGIKGKYRRYVNEDPTQPDPSTSAETWEFFGNRFVNIISDVDSGDGQRKTVKAEGYYFCPDPNEILGIDPVWWNVVLVYAKVEPAGAFGIMPGVVDPCFLGVSTATGSNDLGLGCNLFWDPKDTWQTTDTYCKIGSEVFGRPCTDPFAPPPQE